MQLLLHSLLLLPTLTTAFHPSRIVHPSSRAGASSHLSRPSTHLSLSSTTETLLNDTLIRWLLASGAPPDLHSVRIDTDANGLRGLYANRDIGRDEVIFEIPYELALETGDTLMDGEGGEYLIWRDLDGVDCGEWRVCNSAVEV